MITKSVLLPIDPAAAFRLFTEKVDAWWPADHRPGPDAAGSMQFTAAGCLVERTGNGQDIELGRVVEWIEPSRIVLDFYVATGPTRPTRADITFQPEGSGARVTVNHRPLPASEALWRERAPRYDRSWGVVLASFAAAAAT